MSAGRKTEDHRVDITLVTAHVEVIAGGATVAVSDRPVLVEETGLPLSYYLPRPDIRIDLLKPMATHTTCPFKGEASYWSVEVKGTVHRPMESTVLGGQVLRQGRMAAGRDRRCGGPDGPPPR